MGRNSNSKLNPPTKAKTTKAAAIVLKAKSVKKVASQKVKKLTNEKRLGELLKVYDILKFYLYGSHRSNKRTLC
jgi:hypothetical protein